METETANEIAERSNTGLVASVWRSGKSPEDSKVEELKRTPPRGGGLMSKTIKFSHHYPKLHGQTSATLLAVLPLRIDKYTPKELLEYDTKFDGGYFPLKTGEYIQLVFIGNLRIPFCTIRSAFRKEKVMYYTAAIGEKFDIEFVKED